MQQKILEFSVNDQHIRTPRTVVVADSRDYLIARFTFNETWRDLTKTAVFQGADGQAYYMLLEDDCCRVPEEVIQPTRFLVSVFGGDRLTTDRAMVEVEASGFTQNGIDPPTPTPDVYNQLLESVALDRQIAEASAVTAAEKAEECAYLTASAEGLLENATVVNDLVIEAQDHAFHASADALLAEEKATIAVDAAETAVTATENAVLASQTAVTAAANAESSANAAAEALAAAKSEWRLLQTVEVTDPTDAITLTFPGLGLKELYFEGVACSQDRTTMLQNFSIGITRSTTIWSANGSFGNASYPNVMTRGHLFLSPSNTLVCDATVSLYGYTLDGNGKSFTSVGRFNESAFTNISAIGGLYLKVAGGFAAGTSFKVWGR